jgi:hypothetical protein
MGRGRGRGVGTPRNQETGVYVFGYLLTVIIPTALDIGTTILRQRDRQPLKKTARSDSKAFIGLRCSFFTYQLSLQQTIFVTHLQFCAPNPFLSLSLNFQPQRQGLELSYFFT